MSNNTAKRPEFYISEITCGDGTQISINANDIIVFVGPNNSGKSQALKDIYTLYLSTLLLSTKKSDNHLIIGQSTSNIKIKLCQLLFH